MAVGDRKWCDFVVFTAKGISVERINYDEEYWMNTLLFGTAERETPKRTDKSNTFKLRQSLI